MTTELITERLRLRQWTDADLPVWAAMNADPRVREFFPGTLTLAESAASIEYFRGAMVTRGWGWWAVEVTATGEFVGMAGLDPVDEDAPVDGVEVGWRLAAGAWGHGYATEAARAVLRFGFGELDLPEILAITVRGNVRSRRVMERLGMVHDPAADFEDRTVPPGPLRPCVVYRVGPETLNREICGGRVDVDRRDVREDGRRCHHRRRATRRRPQYGCTVRVVPLIGGCQMSSGPGSDPHLLALLRAIRLRQSAPDAAAAGAADTAAALSEIAAAKRDPDPEPAPSPAAARSGTPAYPSGIGHPVVSGDTVPESPGGRVGGVGAAGRSATPPPSAGPAPQTGGSTPQPGPTPPRVGSELLWRGGQGAALGRSGLGGRRPGTPGQPDRAGASAAYGVPVNRVNPITGVNPAGPATPVPSVPGVPKARPIGGAGTEFPSVTPAEYAAHFARNTTRRSAAADGMDPGDTMALRDTQRLLSTSLTFAGGTDEVAARLWEALLQAQPDLLTALPGTAGSQAGQLARALTWLVHRLDDPPAVVAGCGRLGAALAECGVQWKQLQLVGAALAEAVRAGMAPGVWRQDFDQAWRWTWQHVYEWLVHGGTLIAYQPTVWDTEVISHELRRPDLAVVRLRPFLPMPYRPGQYARVEVDAVPGIWRPYSLAGAPQLDDVIELHVRAKTETGVSGTLVHDTRVGDRVRVTRAEGDMGLPAEPGRGVLMIAGDTGVAPMKAMLAQLAAVRDPRPAVLFWGVRNLRELYDVDSLMAIAREAPRATVIPVISEGDPGPYPFGLVTDAVATYGEWSRHEVYLAGPPLMLAATALALHQLGVSPARIHHDAPE